VGTLAEFGGMSINPAQPIPIYYQLKTLLLEEILSGRYGPEARLPTEHELCDQYAISRTPVSRALSELAEEGVILRHRRRGTFVNPHWLARRPDQPEVRVVVSEGPWGDLLRSVAPEDLQVNLITVPLRSLHQVLTHAVAEGQAPDLAILDSVWIPEFAADGFLRELDNLDEEWFRNEHERDFLEPIVDANRYAGRTFGVSPFANIAGFWYRRSAVEAVGLLPPRTWSELRSVGRAVAQNGLRHPIVMTGGSKGGETTAYCLIAFLESNGARVLAPEGITLDSRATAQALRFLRSLIDDRLMSIDVLGYEWTKPVRLLAEGKAAISFGGSYETRTLAEALDVPLDELWDHVGFMPVPAGPAGAPATVAGTMSYVIFRQAPHPALAMRLLQRAVAPEELARVGRQTGRIPARRSAVRLAGPSPQFLAQTVDMLERAALRPPTPLYPRVSAQLQSMLEATLTGRLGAAAAARRTAELIGAITGLPVVSELDAVSRPSAVVS
jgi:ABC-type glycerol-3-phosphate transport system substrate-binding protein/DNA-binding transcriptional regulator YhcF (GntR family)